MGTLTNVNNNPQLTQYLVDNKLIRLQVVDIGARGGFAKCWEIYQHGSCLDIVGFDPDLKQEKLSNGRCIPRALSGDGKNRVFYNIRYPASSGFYPPNVDFVNRLINRDIMNIIGTREIETITLDSLNLQPDFIKLDVEGSELDILSGGLETLKGVLGLSVEVAFTELFRSQPMFFEIDGFLKAQGFALFDLELHRIERRIPTKGREILIEDKGQVMVGQGLYFRDIYPELDKYDVKAILKLASMFELFNLSDCAYEILNAPRTKKYLEFLGGI